MTQKNIIIGNGLIAKSLANLNFGKPTLIFASGVSNSLETKIDEFQRESNLLIDTLQKYHDSHIIYCSTCSIDSHIKTPYTIHKLAMEDIILSKSNSCHIFRLPQVVGLVHNNTLISYFIKSILHGHELKVQVHATRNLLDVRDFARVASIAVLNNSGINKPVNISSSTQVKVGDILDEISRLLGRKAHFEKLDLGYSQIIDTSFLYQLLPPNDVLFDPAYWQRVLQHYVKLIAEDIEYLGKPL